MSGQWRRRLDMRSWRAVMRRFDAAGPTVSEFCARQGLSESSFYRWRTRLGALGGVVALARPLRVQTLAVQPAATARRIGPGHRWCAHLLA